MNIIHTCIMYMYLQKLPSISFNIIIQGKLKLIHTISLKIMKQSACHRHFAENCLNFEY